jgi:hypothetical protein
VSAALNRDDVARFVSEYMGGQHHEAASGNLLTDIAEAYLKARGLPPSDLPTVVQMVDSVL